SDRCRKKLLVAPCLPPAGSPGSALTGRAKYRCPLAQPRFLEKLAAEGAGFAATAIHQQRLLKIAWFAVATDEVAQGGAALLDGALQYILDVARQPLIAFETDATGAALGMNATEEQRFIGVDVAHAHHDMAVHDEALDG